MKEIKLLSISNSFGVNLQSYAHQIAKANKINLDIYVLYIGGCSLERHTQNIKNNSKAYELFHNGESTKKMVSISEALKYFDKWDYILTQQVSVYSGIYDSYYPYLTALYEYIKENTKFETFGFQETWQYGKNIPFKEQIAHYNNDPEFMYSMIVKTYKKIKSDFEDAIIVNSGDIIHNAQKTFKENMYDEVDFHLSPIGCYLIGANLVKLLTQEKLKGIYVPNKPEFNNDYCKKLIDFVNIFATNMGVCPLKNK